MIQRFSLLSSSSSSSSAVGAHQLQRTGAGRYGSAFFYGANSSTTLQSTGTTGSPQNNLDSLESYDSGLGLGKFTASPLFS